MTSTHEHWQSGIQSRIITQRQRADALGYNHNSSSCRKGRLKYRSVEIKSAGDANVSVEIDVHFKLMCRRDWINRRRLASQPAQMRHTLIFEGLLLLLCYSSYSSSSSFISSESFSFGELSLTEEARLIVRETDRQTQRERDRERETETETETERQRDRQTDRQSDRDRETDT